MAIPSNIHEIVAEAVADGFVLDRCEAVPAMISRHQDFLIVSGLAGTSKDVPAPTGEGADAYTMVGAMAVRR
jgi:hypothetical protein